MPVAELPVLMYHAVADISGPLRDLGVPAGLLGEHLDALRGDGYQLLGLSAALDLVAAGERAVALTFDDAYADFGDALPILADYGASATLYVPVSAVGTTARWLGGRAVEFAPILGWPDLRALADAGIEIGNHGLVHEPMDVLAPASAARQVAVSQDRIHAEIGRPARSFAYPHGYHTAKVRAAVAVAGHDNACTVGRRVARTDDDRFAIPRLQPTPDVDGDRLLDMIHGNPALITRVKGLVQPGWRLTRKIARTAGVRLT